MLIQLIKRSHKLLGINFDEFLSFDQHAGFLCAKLSKILYCLRRASSLLSEKSLKLLYVSFINANLLYCCNIVGNIVVIVVVIVWVVVVVVIVVAAVTIVVGGVGVV